VTRIKKALATTKNSPVKSQHLGKNGNNMKKLKSLRVEYLKRFLCWYGKMDSQEVYFRDLTK